MRLDRRRLEDVLNILGTAVGNKVIKAADYVCFRLDKAARALVLCTTDFRAFLAVDFGDLEGTQLDAMPDVFMLHYRMLSAIVKNSTTDFVEIEDGKVTMTVTTNGTYKLRKYQELDDFPGAQFECDSSVSWEVPLIVTAWNKARVAVSKDVTKISYQGVYFDGNFVATDNRRVAVASGFEYDGPPLLIPPIFGDVLKHCRNEIEVGSNKESNLVIVKCPEVGLNAGVRLIDATFAAYKPLMASMDPVVSVVVNKQMLLGAIARLMPFTDQMFKVVRIDVNSSNMVLSVEHNDAGVEVVDLKSVESKVTPVAPSDDYAIASSKYHLDNICDGVSVVDSPDDVAIHFDADGKLWVIEEQFAYLQTDIPDEPPR